MRSRTLLFQVAIAAVLGLAATAFDSGSLWFMLRSKGKRSRRHRFAVVAITMWLILMVPLAIFASTWIEL